MSRLDTLRKRLSGAFDLRKPDDCQKVILTLLRSRDKAQTAVSTARRALRALALDVIEDRSLEAEEKAMEALATPEEPGDPKSPEAQVVGFIAKMSDETARAEDLADERLVDELQSGLWANLDMSGRDSCLLAELIRRFENKEGR